MPTTSDVFPLHKNVWVDCVIEHFSLVRTFDANHREASAYPMELREKQKWMSSSSYTENKLTRPAFFLLHTFTEL